MGFPVCTGGREPFCQCRRCKRGRFDPWVRKISWWRTWQSTPVSLPGESHGQRACGLQSIESQRVGDDWSDLSLIRDTSDHSNSRSTHSCLFSSPVLFTLRNEVSQSESPNISALEYLLFDWPQELGNTCLQPQEKRKELIEQNRQMVIIKFLIQHHKVI